jgi:hypothetical protein
MILLTIRKKLGVFQFCRWSRGAEKKRVFFPFLGTMGLRSGGEVE